MLPFSSSYYDNVFSAGRRPNDKFFMMRGPGNGRSSVMEKSGSGAKEPERVRSDFPETWLWSDTTMG